MPKTVLVPIADGCEEIEAVTIIDCLRRAGADLTVASVGSLQVTASRSTKLLADKLIADCTNDVFDLIALPGGMPGAENLRDSKELIEMLIAQANAGRLYAAICASPAIVFQPHGLLEGKSATCYPSFAEKLTNQKKANQTVVIDGNCITSQGPGTAMQFAMTLIAQLFDKQTAQKTALPMIVPYSV